MADITDAEIDAALVRGRIALHAEARAVAARYDRETRRVMIELANGCTFAFPAALAQGLENAEHDDLEAVELLGSGSGLHWEALDADLSIPDLLTGFFGTKAHMAKMLKSKKPRLVP